MQRVDVGTVRIQTCKHGVEQGLTPHESVASSQQSNDRTLPIRRIPAQGSPHIFRDSPMAHVSSKVFTNVPRRDSVAQSL